MEGKKLTKRQKAKQEGIETLRKYCNDNSLDFDEIMAGLEFYKKHQTIIARSARKLSMDQGINEISRLVGHLILVVLQLGEYPDPEYLHSATFALLDIYQQATRDNADPSELFEIMAATSHFENNNNPSIG